MKELADVSGKVEERIDERNVTVSFINSGNILSEGPLI